MNLGKLKKKLRREVAAHPAKAAVLGMLCVVALWFWTPLVWGWIAPRGSAPKAVLAETSGGPQFPGRMASATPGPEAAPELHITVHPWQQIVQWMEQDPQTKPIGTMSTSRGPATALLRGWLPWSRREDTVRDPFFRSAPVDAAADATELPTAAEVAAAPAPITPQEAGASVTSVVAGPAGGAAVINGQTYMQGQLVRLQKDEVSYTFQLSETQPGMVVLVRDGRRYELHIPRTADHSQSARTSASEEPPALGSSP